MSEAYGKDRGYRFGEFILDPGRGGLFRNGDPVKLRPKSFDVLSYLVERHGRLVTRDDLLNEVWAGTVVTEDAVTQCLIDIRKALGDSEQTMIRTVPRRGYVFEAGVEVIAGPSNSQSPGGRSSIPGRGWLIAAAGVVAIGVAVVAGLGLRGSAVPDAGTPSTDAKPPSIAVLPFESMGPDASRAYFADGVSEEIINSLARQQDLKVIARTSSFSFRGQNADVSTIASQLDVSHVLEGSVREDGDALRINVQLVDAGTGEYVWTEQFDRELSATSLFAIQTEIATAVVRSLQTTLTPEQRARLVRVPTDNMSALDAYFEARQLMETRRPSDLDRAADLLRTAIDLDADFALAYVALADTLRLQSNYGSLPERIADAEGMVAVRRALAIDDQLGEAYASLGNILARRGDYPAAEAAFLRGIELSPSYAPLYQWYGQFLWVYDARPDEGVPYARISAALDPRSAIINNDYAGALIAAGRLAEAAAQLDAVIDIDPNFALAYLDKGWLFQQQGNYVDAVALFEKGYSLSPDSRFGPISLARAFIDLGVTQRSTAVLAEADDIAPGSPGVAGIRLVLASLAGDDEAATALTQHILSVWPWHTEALRYLRDRELERHGVDAAIDVYRPVFNDLLGEQPGAVGPENYAQAVDIAYLLMLAGRDQRAKQILDECRAFTESRPRSTWFGSPIADVKIEAILGNTDAALALLESAVEDGWRENWQFELEHDRALAGLRETPAYAAIVETIRTDINEQRKRLFAQD